MWIENIALNRATVSAYVKRLIGQSLDNFDTSTWLLRWARPIDFQAIGCRPVLVLGSVSDHRNLVTERNLTNLIGRILRPVSGVGHFHRCELESLRNVCDQRGGKLTDHFQHAISRSAASLGCRTGLCSQYLCRRY